MDPNNPNPYQQPGNPQPQVPPQPVGQPQQPQVVGAPYTQPVPPVPPAQPVYAQPQMVAQQPQPAITPPNPYNMQPVPPPAPQPMQPQMAGSPYNYQTASSLEASPKSNSKLVKIIIIVAAVIVIAVVAILSVYLLNKNGGLSGSSSVTTTKTACQLFTLSDAQALIGSSATVNNSGAAAPAGTTSCNYQVTGGAFIVAAVSTFPSSSVAITGYNEAVKTVAKVTSVPGIGQRASYGGNFLFVQDGKVFFVVGANDANGNPDETYDTQAAKTIISNF